jgi:hypothetical protein
MELVNKLLQTGRDEDTMEVNSVKTDGGIIIKIPVASYFL